MLQKIRRGRACRFALRTMCLRSQKFCGVNHIAERLIIWIYWLVSCKSLLNLLNLHSKKIKKGSG